MPDHLIFPIISESLFPELTARVTQCSARAGGTGDSRSEGPKAQALSLHRLSWPLLEVDVRISCFIQIFSFGRYESSYYGNFKGRQRVGKPFQDWSIII